jgi:phosphatidylethanolamine/phosphatidyl-N-methylethanolamine N-methyltransferase
MQSTAESTMNRVPSLDAAQAESTAVSRRGYRRFAPLYDFVFGRGLHDARKLAIDALACERGERILEVCVGSGLSLDLYPEEVDVVGVDLSREMLSIAARRIEEHPVVGGRHLLQMNAERLCFADGTFDKAIVLFGVAGLPDPVRAMHELRRVCRTGARIVIASRFRSGPSWMSLYDFIASPLYRFLAYRSDLDRDQFVSGSGLIVENARTANLFGYATVLVCRNP